MFKIRTSSSREALASVADLTEKLDKCFEENAWLQSELDEREEANRELIQRLRDEISGTILPHDSHSVVLTPS